jgi:transcriptional regulator GlxA family with amidase domain
MTPTEYILQSLYRLKRTQLRGSDMRIQRAELMMYRHLERKLSLTVLASQAGLSVGRFAHLFKQETGVSPAHYLKTIRLECARDLLESASLSIKEIAACVGINQGGLSREFRLAFGLAPRRYRSQAQRVAYRREPASALHPAGFAYE